MKKYIENIKSYELLDSRGNPTVGTLVILSDGSQGFSVVPSGASTGKHEACELRDNDKTRYSGKGVRTAVDNVNTIIDKAINQEKVADFYSFDRLLTALDGTENKSRLGANAVLSASLAAARAFANSYQIPLYRYIGGLAARIMPRPMLNILNGGAHAGNNIDIQEFMITPVCYDSFSEGLRMCTEVYHTLGKLIKNAGLSAGVGDEGGFAPSFENDETALEMICKAIKEAGYDGKIKICLDVAASEWKTEKGYLRPKRNVTMTDDELIDWYLNLVSSYPIISIEDGVGEDDIYGWKKLTENLGNKIQLVGDDLFVTNCTRLENGIQSGIANAILIKPNQIGTLSETLAVIELAKQNGYATVISHRSGETEDSFIADLAVGVNAGQIKTGAPCRSDRTSKYNRLLIIENEL